MQEYSKTKRIAGAVFCAVIVIAIWQIVYMIGVDGLNVWKSYTMPSPGGVAQSMMFLCAGGSIFKAIGFSLLRGVAGYAIAIVIGTCLGLLINQVKLCKLYLKPLILGIQTLPSICWVPFSILWFGLKPQAIIFVVVMGSAFGISISIDAAIEGVPSIYKKAALTMGATKSQLYWKVIFPACIPALISGLKQGWSFAWRALMSGEVMTTCVGLGQTLMTGRDMADINQVMLVMVIIVVVGILIDKLVFEMIEKKVAYHV